MRHPAAWCILLLLITAGLSPAAAYPRLYRVTVDGARKAGSELCFYRAELDANVLARFIAAAPASCVPAAEKLDLPDGSYRVFARHRDGYVSDTTLALVNRAGPVPRKQQEGPEEIPMRRAAFADFTDVLQSRRVYDTPGVWLMPGRVPNGAFFPLVSSESTVMIPEHRTAVPLLLRQGVPVAIGEPMTLDAGERGKVQFGPTRPGHGDVVAWVDVDSAAIEETADFPAPELEARAADDVTFAPLVPAESLQPGTSSLVFFRGLPAGPARLMAGGKFWQASEQAVEVQAGRATAVHDPLLPIPGAALSVTWDLDGSRMADDASPPDRACGAEPHLIVGLERCDHTPEDLLPHARPRAV